MWLTNLFGRAKNISSDIASELKKQVRLRLCSGCPKYKKDFRYFFIKKKGVPQCGKCKCAIHDKVIWEDEKCPIGKW